MPPDNTKRFSNRVQDYIKYRPHYPESLINLLEETGVLHKKSIIADIGSGTGISSLPFLENENSVYAVEPNKEMREAGEELLSSYANFTSLNGTAENTGLADHSVDLIFAGQAFHWFDRERAKIEFSRILKQEGHIVFVWNQRDDSTSFLQEYEYILSTTINAYAQVNHREDADDDLLDFFSPKVLRTHTLPNFQNFDLTGLKGRLQSSSYCPKDGPEHIELMKKIEELFEKHQKNGLIRFQYQTRIYWC